MSSLTIIGFVLAVLMGLALGLVGGGGSIFTVPILVYLFRVDPMIAATYSLFVVGITSYVGGISHFRTKTIHWKTLFTFGLPSLSAIFFARIILLPAIPATIFQHGNLILTKAQLLLLCLGALMLVSSHSLLRRNSPIQKSTRYDYFNLVTKGIAVGFVTGLIGIGGGFLIMPALIVFAQLSMRQAVGTSLTMISINSLVGFWCGSRYHGPIDWPFLLVFSSMAIIGIIISNKLLGSISMAKLKLAFAWIMLLMGVTIILIETASIFF